MTSPIAGILFSEEVLSSTWFITLATVVAFNTIVYLGLTLAKLIPLPRQVHPSRVRGWMAKVGKEVSEDSALEDIPTRVLPENVSPYENMRRGIAKRDIPQAFALVGGLIILLALASFIASTGDRVIGSLVMLIVGLLFLLMSQVFGRRDVHAHVVMWTWAMACLVVVEVLVAEAIRAQSQAPLAYTLIVMTAFAPVTLAWRPTFVAAPIMFASMVLAALRVTGSEDVRLAVSSLAALIAGATLLRLRLVALDALSDERERSAAIASTDVLTGVLTRNGLVSLMPGMAAIAERDDDEICIMYFDVNSLAKANEQYGILYGDDVLRSVAESVKEHVRAGDLVARWDGDEFLVAGIGGKPNAEVLGGRIQEAVRITGVNLGRWPTTLKVGTSAGDPRETTFDQLVIEAQQDALGRSGASPETIQGAV